MLSWEIGIWQNGKFTKWEVNKMASWQNGKLTKCHLTKCLLTKWQVDIILSWQNVIRQKGKLTKWPGADDLSLVPLLSWDDQTKRGNFVTIITPLLDFVIHTLKITPRHCVESHFVESHLVESHFIESHFV